MGETLSRGAHEEAETDFVRVGLATSHVVIYIQAGQNPTRRILLCYVCQLCQAF